MSKMILFNAPAKSGKDVVIKYLQEKGIPLQYAECKDKLHKLVQEIFNVPFERYWEIYNDRSLKEVPLPEFKVNLYATEFITLSELFQRDLGLSGKLQLSIREAMIYVSEVLIKPRFGGDYFGNSRMLNMDDEGIYVDGSAAFIGELAPLIDELGQVNILLIRVHREGYTFEGDSRSYIPDGVIYNTYDVDNNGSEQDYFHKVEDVVRKFLNE